MRIPRRGVIAQRKVGGFVWAVYSLAYGIDESAGGTAGNFSVSSNNYRRAAKSYTVSGTYVNLVDSVQTTAANLAPGDYIVTVANTNSTATTGTTLYKVTGVSGSYFSYTISYTAYTPALNARGTDTGQRVESNTADDYPADGVQGDYYYVMVKGYGTVYVWDVYNYTPGWSTVTSTPSQDNPPIGISTSSYAGYEVSSTIGYNQNKLSTMPDITSGKAVFSNSGATSTVLAMLDEKSNYNHLYYGINNSDHFYDHYSIMSGTTRIRARYRLDIVDGKKGAATGEQVQSLTSTAYPSDGVQGDYWYTYNSSYTGWFDFT